MGSKGGMWDRFMDFWVGKDLVVKIIIFGKREKECLFVYVWEKIQKIKPKEKLSTALFFKEKLLTKNFFFWLILLKIGDYESQRDWETEKLKFSIFEMKGNF